MTPKQRLFIQEYLIDANATQAAIRAGYSAKTAHSIGDENLRKPGIAKAIMDAMVARSERTEITSDWVLQTLKSNVDRAMQAEAVTDRDGVETGEYVYNGSVANKALELIGKHLGMFSDKPLGKKEAANIAAKSAHEDTSWAEILQLN